MQALLQYRFFKFGLIGGLAFLIDTGCAWFFLMFLPSEAALALSYFISCLFHYSFSKRWTFRDSAKVSARQVWAYAWVNLATLITNTALSSFSLRFVYSNVFLAKALALLPTSLLGFLLLRAFVFHSRSSRKAN
jgi:putative flippase GtrA